MSSSCTCYTFKENKNDKWQKDNINTVKKTSENSMYECTNVNDAWQFNWPNLARCRPRRLLKQLPKPLHTRTHCTHDWTTGGIQVSESLVLGFEDFARSAAPLGMHTYQENRGSVTGEPPRTREREREKWKRTTKTRAGIWTNLARA